LEQVLSAGSRTKLIGMDHKVRNSVGKIVMECVIETKASTILQFIDGLRGDLRVTFEGGTWAPWLYDLLKPHVTEVLVCNTRQNLSRKQGLPVIALITIRLDSRFAQNYPNTNS
jgi:hypothetical protein